MPYSRSNPSPRYRELVSLYQRMHRDGIPEQNVPSNELYVGKSLIGHLPKIRSMVRETGARSLLDYGSGKGLLYRQRNVALSSGEVISSIQEYLGVDRIVCYDPAVPEHANFPSEQFDGVVSTDALEHCPEEDIPWIVGEMFAAARKFVYANVASYPAKKILPNGENAHATQQPAAWWAELLHRLAAQRPELVYYFKIRQSTAKRNIFQRLFSRDRRVVTLSNAA